MRPEHIGYPLGAVIMLVMLSCVAPKPAATPAAGEPAIDLTMPAGWSDAVLERVKNGQGLKHVMAVLDFEGQDKLQGRVDQTMAGLVSTALAASSKFDLVERARIDQVLKEQGSQPAILMEKPAVAAEIGRLLGTDFVVWGAVSGATEQALAPDRAEIHMEVRLVNTTAGRVVYAEKVTGKSDHAPAATADGTAAGGAPAFPTAFAQAARQAADNAGRKIADRFPLMGFIIQVAGEQVFTDVGEERGVRKGDVFIVFRIGDEIKHPATGVHLGWTKRILGAIRIVDSEGDLSTGLIAQRAESGGEIMLGDFIIAR